MGDMGELFNDLKEFKKKNKLKNLEYAENIMNKYNHRRVDEYLFNVGDFDFWPSTGLFINRITKNKGRGINKLLPLIEKFKKEVL